MNYLLSLPCSGATGKEMLQSLQSCSPGLGFLPALSSFFYKEADTEDF